MVTPKLGIIGGSGMCSFPELKVISKVRPRTQYGLPSDDILICKYKKKVVAFLPRHGSKHKLPPHKVPYRANIAALKNIGVEHIIGTCIAGSLQRRITPGTLVVPDQFVNLTWGRDDCHGKSKSFMHLPMGEPYCKNMRKLAIKVAKSIGAETISSGTVAVIQGPRFNTKAESLWLKSNKWDIVNMTQYPECYFAKEQGLCYAVLAAITDYDVGLKENLTINLKDMSKILKVFNKNILLTKKTLLEFIEQTPNRFTCECAKNMIKTYYEMSKE